MRILFILCAAQLSATLSPGAGVSIIPTPSPPAPMVFNANHTLLLTGRFRLGYFINQTNDPQFREALATSGLVNDWMEQYFIPLGEPLAPIFATLGGGVPALGASVQISQRLMPMTSQYAVGGSVGAGAGYQFLFTDEAPPNTYSSAGLPRGSRLFLIAYPTTDISNTDGAGIFSATTWLVPGSPQVNVMSMTMAHVDTPEEVYRGGLISFGIRPALVLPLVPEPSCVAFLAMGALLLTRRRRRGNFFCGQARH